MIELNEITTDKILLIRKENMSIIKKNIKRIMKEQKLTQCDLAFAIRSNQPFLCYFLRRGGNASIDFIGRIAEALNTNITTLTKK